jgi:hypothetical protein
MLDEEKESLSLIAWEHAGAGLSCFDCFPLILCFAEVEWLVVGGSALYCSVLCICNNMTTRCLNVDGFGG